jgi:adenosylcobinamide-phosphate synthase
LEILIAIVIGFALDLLLGDPAWFPHPVRLIGRLISGGEKLLRKWLPKKEFAGGVLLTVFVVAVSFLVPFLILYLLSLWNVYVRLAVEAFFCYQIFATKCLRAESMRVYHYLEKGDLANSRKYLSWIVGRDTQNLNGQQITKATVETIAENTSDGVIAPMLFMMIGGAPLGFLYKAVNTLDSMIGYKNENYLLFGKFAARLDDVVNFIPAILSAWIMIAASFFSRLDAKNALRIFRRDRHNHASPNSAKTEAVAAGALRIQLAGDAYYFGKLVRKQTIGDPLQAVVPQDIKRMNRLMYVTALMALLLFAAARFALVMFL